MTNEIVPVGDESVILRPVMNLMFAKERLAEFQQFVREYLVEGEDFGTIPGTPKPTLYKPGADKLCDIYGLADTYTYKEVENWQAEPPLFDYTVTCTLVSRRDSRLIGSGVGSCNSWESRYKYRESRRKCPLCSKETIMKSKAEWGGGWYCNKKKEGCGAKFVDGDQVIESQASGKSINDDIAALKNTVLKMAKKRAKVDAVLSVTRSSGIFTQDIEDISDHGDDGQGTKAAAQRAGEEAKAKLQAKKEQRGNVTIQDLEKAIGNVKVDSQEVATPQLTVVQVGEDKYEITGAESIMEDNAEKLAFWRGKRVRDPKTKQPIKPMAVQIDGVGLDSFRHHFEKEQHGELIALKATWAKGGPVEPPKILFDGYPAPKVGKP